MGCSPRQKGSRTAKEENKKLARDPAGGADTALGP